jgi:hypothetical protein
MRESEILFYVTTMWKNEVNRVNFKMNMSLATIELQVLKISLLKNRHKEQSDFMFISKCIFNKMH